MSKALQNEPKTDIRQIGLSMIETELSGNCSLALKASPPPEFDIQNLPQNLIWFPVLGLRNISYMAILFIYLSE